MASNRWKFNQVDLERVGRNALIFIAPIVITMLTMFQQGVTDPQTYLYTIQIWVLGVTLDFFRKLYAGKPAK
jgi:hypothetical protein